jgi:hypothetical protein
MTGRLPAENYWLGGGGGVVVMGWGAASGFGAVRPGMAGASAMFPDAASVMLML